MDTLHEGSLFLARVNPDNLKKARDYFQQAIDKQANFAMAHAGLADVYLLLAFNLVWSLRFRPFQGREPRRSRHLNWILRSPRRTRRLRESPARSTRTGRQRSGDTGGPSRSIRTTPSHISGGAPRWLDLGRHAEATVEIRRALELDPVSLRANNAAGAILYLGRRYPEAIEQYRKTLELEPGYAPSLIGLGRVYTALGQKTEALRELEHAAKISNRTSISLAALGTHTAYSAPETRH